MILAVAAFLAGYAACRLIHRGGIALAAMIADVSARVALHQRFAPPGQHAAAEVGFDIVGVGSFKAEIERVDDGRR